MGTHNPCFLSRNKKNNVYPCKPQFYYIKVGFKGVKIILVCFRNVEVGVASQFIQHELRAVPHF